jgi:hypothetical protein
MAIEEMEKPTAAERQATNCCGGGPRTTTVEPEKWGHRTRGIAAEAIEATYQRIKTIVSKSQEES